MTRRATEATWVRALARSTPLALRSARMVLTASSSRASTSWATFSLTGVASADAAVT